MDDIKDGQRINCHGVTGTVIGKRSTRNRRFVLVKMDNGFTLKLNAQTLSAGLPEIPRTSVKSEYEAVIALRRVLPCLPTTVIFQSIGNRYGHFLSDSRIRCHLGERSRPAAGSSFRTRQLAIT